MHLVNSCPLCSSKNLSALYSVRVTKNDVGWYELLNAANVDFTDYDVVNCADCDLLFRNLRFSDSDFNLLYSGSKSPGSRKPDYIKYAGRTNEVKEFLKKYFDYSLWQKSILDVGGGRGEISYAFVKDDQCKCDILEFGMEGEQIFKNLNIVSSVEDKKYDFVLFCHILEHLTSPGEFVKNILSKLGSATKVYIEVPYEGPHYYLLKTKGHYEHINYFSSNSLTNLVHSIGGTNCIVKQKIGFGASIPVLVAVFDFPASKESIVSECLGSRREAFSLKSLFLLGFSKLKILFNFVDRSHKKQRPR